MISSFQNCGCLERKKSKNQEIHKQTQNFKSNYLFKSIREHNQIRKMKRKARLNFSTEYFPYEDQATKRFHFEDSLEHHEYDYHPKEFNEVISIIEEKDSDLKKVDEVQELIQSKLKTNPIRLINDGKENQYGNFRSYYEYRCEKKWNDPRLGVFEREWFFNKEVLDIGCNDGSLTLQLAIKFFPFKIQGIDIDYNLINQAVSNILTLEKSQAKCKDPKALHTQTIDQEKLNNIANQKRIQEKLSKMSKCFLLDKSKLYNVSDNVQINESGHSILNNEDYLSNVKNDIPQIKENIYTSLDKTIQEEMEMKQINNVFQNNQQIKEIVVDPLKYNENIINQVLNEFFTEDNSIEANKTQSIGIIDLSQSSSKKEDITEIQTNNGIEQHIIRSFEINLNDEQINKDVTKDEQFHNSNDSLINNNDKKLIEMKSTFHNQEENDNCEVLQLERVEIKNRFPNNVRFRLENYIQDQELSEKYDTICCFSTTKWIHLNFGDEGIKRLFHKVFRSLRVNGLFILEPQEWRSYKKSQSFSLEVKQIIKSIKLHPGEFKNYLLTQYKYILEKEIIPIDNLNKVPSFFKRVIYVFRKIE